MSTLIPVQVTSFNFSYVISERVSVAPGSFYHANMCFCYSSQTINSFLVFPFILQGKQSFHKAFVNIHLHWIQCKWYCESCKFNIASQLHKYLTSLSSCIWVVNYESNYCSQKFLIFSDSKVCPTTKKHFQKIRSFIHTIQYMFTET